MAFERIKKFAKKVRAMFGGEKIASLDDVKKEKSVASAVMLDSIDEWLDMYAGNAPWLQNTDQSLGIPALLAAEIARCVTLEMSVTISGSPMADFINEQFDDIRKDIRVNTEYACAGGGLVFKPYVRGETITTEVVQANAFFPTSFDSSKRITGAVFVYKKWREKKVYTRLEQHELGADGYTVANTAFVSEDANSLGDECALTEVEEWAKIEPTVHFDNIKSPLFAYFKIPVGNAKDMNSPLGVSVFSRAVNLIKEADLQYQRLLWEYKGGELAIDAVSDAFHKGADGKPMLPEGKERLFRANKLDAATMKGENLLKAWTPALRDGNYIAGLNRLLIQIEDACSMSRGTLSDPSEVAKSATEIKIMKQRSYALVKDIQKALETALNELIYAMYCIATLYGLAPDGEYAAVYEWDDSILVDSEAERIRDQQEVSQGLMLPYEYRMKWYGEDEATARKKLGEVVGMTDEEIMGFSSEPEASAGNLPKR